MEFKRFSLFRRDARRPAVPGWLQLLSLAMYPLFCLISIEYFNYKALCPGERVYQVLLLHVKQFGPQTLFGLLVIYLVFLFLLLLLRRAWIATGLLGAVSLLCAFVNYMKINLNGMPFVPMDLSLIGVTKELSSYISIPIPWLFWLALAIVLLYTAALAWLGTAVPGRWYVRLPGAALLLLTFFLGAALNFTWGARVLAAFHMNLFDNVSQTSNYTANGFVGGFTLNLMGMHTKAPEGYSQEAVTACLQDYPAAAADPDAPEYDVIVILAESFFDLRQLEGVTYSEDPLPNYDAILAEENCYSGNIYTIALGGGTVNTEFRVLTGLNTDSLLPPGATPYNYVRHDLEGYVSNYKSAGYNTIGLHLYNPNFYSRNNAYPQLGFDAFYTLDEVAPYVPISYTRGYATDASTEQAIEYYLDGAGETGKPTFLFAITIENHQPYGENENNTISVTADGLDASTRQALATYAQGAKDADDMLGALRDYIDRRQRPTVLVWFGDHLPTLGVVHTPYQATHYYTNEDTVENRMQQFHTPFLVYANRPLEQGLFPSKTDNQLSDIYLMECVAAATGFQQTSYMRYLADAMTVLPIYNIELRMDELLTPEQQEITRCWSLIAYDRMLGRRYSVSERSMKP